MILVSHHPTGGYRMYDPMKHEVVITRDVIVAKTDS